MDELVAACEAHNLAVTAWSFVQLQGGESLQQHVSRRMDDNIPIYLSQEVYRGCEGVILTPLSNTAYSCNPACMIQSSSGSTEISSQSRFKL
jgi:hypothetical protein